MFVRGGRKSETKEKHGILCQPVGLYPGLGRFGRRHGERLGFSKQNGQQTAAARSCSIYLLFVCIFSYVGLPAEFAMGRRAATGTLGAYENAWATRGKSAGKAGGLLGWLPLAGSLCIAIGYAVIVTYVLKALVDSLVGTLMSADAGELVRRVLLHALRRDSLPYSRRRRHAADALPRRAQHRKEQQDHDAAVFYHFPCAGRARGVSAGGGGRLSASCSHPAGKR